MITIVYGGGRIREYFWLCVFLGENEMQNPVGNQLSALPYLHCYEIMTVKLLSW